MPYIKVLDRELVDRTGQPTSAGQLNYAITKLVKGYIDYRGVSYNTINEIIGVLECSKLETYRRVGEPYENAKISENGDVY